MSCRRERKVAEGRKGRRDIYTYISRKKERRKKKKKKKKKEKKKKYKSDNLMSTRRPNEIGGNIITKVFSLSPSLPLSLSPNL